MSNLTVENVYTRQSAKELAKQHFWKLVCMTLIVGAIVYGVMFGGMMLLSAATGVSFDAMENAIDGIESVPGTSVNMGFLLGYFLLILVTVLIGGGLGLGMICAMIDLCRGDETVTVGRVFSRMKHCLKAFGLSLWVGLKTFLWMLPGYAAVALFALAMAGVSSENEGVMALLMLLSVVLVFALVIPAALRYMLSTYVLSDEPARGIRECVNLSKTMMKGHKWQAFKLTIPVFLSMYGVMLLMGIVMGLIGAVLSEVSAVASAILGAVAFIVMMITELYFGIRMELCYCLFYISRRDELVAPAAEAEAAE